MARKRKMGAGLLLVGPKYKLRKHGCAHNHITPAMKRRTQSFNFLKMTSAFRTNNMKSCFLLIMFLLTAFEMSEHNECRTWVEFTCNKAKATEKHYIKYETKQIPEVVFRELKSEESWKKTCKMSNPSSSTEKPPVKIKCQKQFNQTAYRTTKTTIKCDYEGDKKPFFFCKENNSVCKNMVESPRQSNSRFTFTKTNRNFSLSISNVSSQDEGVYWCGVKLEKEVVIKKINLNVEHISNFTRSPAAGQNFTYWCKCKEKASPSKSICKGDDPSICQPLVTTSESDKNKKFFINDEDKTNITVTIINVTADDSGTYWCRAKKNNQQICNRLILTVVSPPTSTSTISSTTATTTATTTAAAAAAGRRGVSEAIISVIVCVAVLLFVILMILIYKRFSSSKNTGNGAAACRTKEDCTFEKIQERLQLSDSENATNTIYATVSSPNPAPLTHYATINFQNSDEAAGETVRLSYSACEYSTVKFPKCPTDLSDTQLHRPTEEPVYSTVNKPRK